MADLFDMQCFKGQISKVKKEVLTHTSGEVKATEIKTKYSFFGKQIISGSGGGGAISTTHEHYTNFKLDKASFRCAGDYNFDEGDEVMLYASPTAQGFYEVAMLKNLTQNFVINNSAPSRLISPIGWALGSFLGCVFIGGFAIAIISIILGFFLELSAYYFVLDGLMTAAFFVGLLLGVRNFTKGSKENKIARERNAILEKAYDEIVKFNGL